MATTAQNNIRTPEEEMPVVTGTGEILDDRTGTGRIAPWKEKKQQNGVLYRMYQHIDARRTAEGKPRLMTRNSMVDLRECGTLLEFDVNDSGEKHLHRANFCRKRLCPMCQWRRSLIQFHQTQEQANWIDAHHDGVRYLFLTVTLRNCDPDSLGAHMDILTRAFSLMVGNKRARKGSTRERLKRTLLGSSRVVEVTFNMRKNTMHPHIHAILAVRPSYFSHAAYYISHRQWVELWRECAALDYSPIVSIEAIDTDERNKAVAEVSKYSAKLTNILQHEPDDTDLAEHALESMHLALQRRRLISLSGCFKDAKAALKQQDVDERTDLTHTTDDPTNFQPIERHLYRWRVNSLGHGFYIC